VGSILEDKLSVGIAEIDGEEERREGMEESKVVAGITEGGVDGFRESMADGRIVGSKEDSTNRNDDGRLVGFKDETVEGRFVGRMDGFTEETVEDMVIEMVL